jgi:hypothetical protein
MILVEFLHPKATMAHVGLIPTFLSSTDKRPAAEQFQDRYIGGWLPMEGFLLDPFSKALHYKEDPTMYPLAKIELGKETVLIYPHAWVVIQNRETEKWEVGRMD